jgi:hypothetical protein
MMPFVKKPAAPGLPQRVVVLPVLLAALVAVTFFCVSCTSTTEVSSTTVAGAVAGSQPSGGGVTAAAHATTTSGTGATSTFAGSTDSVISGAASGAATATTKSTKAAGSSTTTSEPLYVSPGTTVATHYLQGAVMGNDGRPLAGATVYVVLNALDPLYRQSGPNLIGSATTDASGNYRVSMSTVPVGTIVDVSAVAEGYSSVLQYGKYEHEVEQVDFIDHGGAEGDRRLPVDDVPPPPPFEDLLPGRSAAR